MEGLEKSFRSKQKTQPSSKSSSRRDSAPTSQRRSTSEPEHTTVEPRSPKRVTFASDTTLAPTPTTTTVTPVFHQINDPHKVESVGFFRSIYNKLSPEHKSDTSASSVLSYPALPDARPSRTRHPGLDDHYERTQSVADISASDEEHFSSAPPSAEKTPKVLYEEFKQLQSELKTSLAKLSDKPSSSTLTGIVRPYATTPAQAPLPPAQETSGVLQRQVSDDTSSGSGDFEVGSDIDDQNDHADVDEFVETEINDANAVVDGINNANAVPAIVDGDVIAVPVLNAVDADAAPPPNDNNAVVVPGIVDANADVGPGNNAGDANVEPDGHDDEEEEAPLLAPLADADFDFPSDLTMSFATPPVFRGGLSDDAGSWLGHISWWLNTQRAPTERAKISYARVLLQDSALAWFDELVIADPPAAGGNPAPEGAITTWEQFKTRFTERFRHDAATQWRDIANLWEVKQLPGQTTEDFVVLVQKKGKSSGATAEQIKMAALAGLRNDIKAVVMQHDPQDLNDIIKRGTCAERFCTPTSPTAIEVNVKSAVEDAVRTALEGCKLRAITTEEAPRTRSVTPPRVRFVEERPPRRESPGGAARDFRPASAGGNPGWMGGRGGGDGWQGYGGWQGGDGRGSGRGHGNRGRGITYYAGYNPNMDSGGSLCGNCGKPHGPGGHCPARGTTCGNCGKPNHWRMCCRSRGMGHGGPRGGSYSGNGGYGGNRPGYSSGGPGRNPYRN